MHFRIFFKVKVHKGGIFGGCLNFKNFLEDLQFLILFVVKGRCLARAYV